MELTDKCSKCGESLQRLMLLALLEDFGAKACPGALDCSAGGEHDFGQPTSVPSAESVAEKE